ncbi:MAG: hypothetical protein HYV60_24055 [Planctomycetia bacterium]|nr:hypothetical protein [Planctomycetia bacterium]
MNTQNKSVSHMGGFVALALAAMLLMDGASWSARPTVDSNNHDAKTPTDGLTQQFSGNIVSAVDGLLLIENAIGVDHRVRVTKETMIMLNDTEVSFDALVSGLHASILAESQGSEWVAMSIDARHQY